MQRFAVSGILVRMRETIVFDIETQRSFADVGGKENLPALGIAVLGAYFYSSDSFRAFEEHELKEFESLLKNTEHLIGFNIKLFDIPVLAPYVDERILARIAVTDIFEDALNFLGHRVGLDGVARATVGAGKSGHGLEALEWFKAGRVEEVKKYCLDDVRLTRDVYEYGKKNGHILFESRGDGKIHSIPVSWGSEVKRPLIEVLEAALEKRKRLTIDYISSQNPDSLGFKKTRDIDVYAIKPSGDIEAYCHLRKDVRTFQLRRILRAEENGESYTLPSDSQGALF